MRIEKAIITAAGREQTQLPLQTVVDRKGRVRSALQLLLDEVSTAGIDEIAIVIQPGEAERYRQSAGEQADRLVFFEQDNPRGYGDALLRAREFVKDEPFLHTVSDHLFVSKSESGCAAQLIEIADREQCPVSAIQPTRENLLTQFGAIGAVPVPQQPGLFEVNTVLEKPSPTVAEQRLVVAGQRAGHYLCLFGMHVLTPAVFGLLEDALEKLPAGALLNLSESLHQLAQCERYLAAQLHGERFNIGEKYGLLLAQLAIALAGEDRDTVLTELVELVAKH